MDCLFCKIARHDIPATIVSEDDAIVAFDDINPKAPVHILIIPKEHIESIAHLTGNQGAMIVQLIYTAQRIANEKGLGGYKLVFNVGRKGGQVIDHVHLHLLGGWEQSDG